MSNFKRQLPMPKPNEYLGKRHLKKRILKALQALATAFPQTRKKQTIFDFIGCMGQVDDFERLPFYSPDACPKRKEKDYLFFCFLAELIQAWWKYDTDDEQEEESKDETQAIIEAALERVEDVTKCGIGAYKICGKPTGYWLEKKDEKTLKMERLRGNR